MKNNLDNIIRRIEKIEKVVFAAKVKAVKPSSKSNSLTEYILSLRDVGFFRQPKSVQEVHLKLEQNYPCELNRVAVALYRMQKNRQLRITSKIVGGKKLQAYVL